MRVLTITHYADLLGANRSLLHLIEGLRERGAVVEVWCPREGAFTRVLHERDIAFRILDFANAAYSFRSIGFFSFGYKWWKTKSKMPTFAAIARQFQPDIIHSNSSVVALGAILSEALQVTHVWHIREYGWLDYQLFYLVGRPFMRQYLQKAAAVIAISNSIAKHIKNEYQFEKLENNSEISIIYNGIGKKSEVELFSKSSFSTENQTENTIIFLIIGLLHPSKNQLQALRAFHLFYKKQEQSDKKNRLKLQIIGNGRRDYKAQLEHYIRKNNLQKNVEMIGFVQQPAPYYQAATAVLMCSPNEAMGRVTAEAMAYKKPVIGYNGGATPELITDGENGWLYDGTDEDLAKKLENFVPNENFFSEKMGEKIGEKMGNNAQKTVLNRFTDEIYTAQVFEVFEKILIEKK